MSKNTGTSELINYFDLGANGDVGIAGSLDINTIANATTDTDTFLVSDTGIIKYRTGAQLLSDIGAQAAGNYVTTDTSQAITANKSFTVGFSLGSEGSGNQTSFFRNTSSLFSGSGGTNIFGFNNSNNIYFGKGLNNGGVLQWNNTTATRYYTLPDADGTIALTSAIPANPIGGTGTTNYLPKFTGSTTIGNSQIIDNGNQVGIGLNPNTSYGTLQIKSPAGVYSLDLVGRTAGLNGESQISFWNAAQSSVLAYITNTGSNLYLGTGANQPFTLSSGGNFIFGTTTDNGARLQVSGSSYFSQQVNIPNNIDIAFGTNTGNYIGQYYNGTDLLFYNGTGGASFFGINRSTGAATFSSSVTAGGTITSSTANYPQLIFQETTTSTNSLIFYDNVGSPKSLRFRVNGATNLMSINDNGNVLIGTTTDNGARLQVSGTATFSSSVIASDVYATFGTGGYVAIRSGGAGAAGYLEIISNNGTTRLGYIGYNTTNILYQAENSANHIFQGGNVGIGTISPATTLEVLGANVSEYLRVGGGTISARSLTFSSFDVSGLSGVGHRLNVQNANGVLAFDIAGTERMRITSSGNVLIGTTTDAGHKLLVNGTARFDNPNGITVASSTQFRQIYFDGFSNLYFWNGSNQSLLTSAGVWQNASDVSIKKEITDIKYGLSDLMLLNPRSYKMKTDGLEQIGFIAQEVEKIIPEVVNSDNKGMKGLSYGNMVALLVKAIQEQQIQIDKLKNS